MRGIRRSDAVCGRVRTGGDHRFRFHLRLAVIPDLLDPLRVGLRPLTVVLTEAEDSDDVRAAEFAPVG